MERRRGAEHEGGLSRFSIPRAHLLVAVALKELCVVLDGRVGVAAGAAVETVDLAGVDVLVEHILAGDAAVRGRRSFAAASRQPLHCRRHARQICAREALQLREKVEGETVRQQCKLRFPPYQLAVAHKDKRGHGSDGKRGLDLLLRGERAASG